ncbi:MAG: 2-oxoacid:acceptor oxidoreductase family protein [Planctomycetota bacterium]|jgi:2-oxoglutarate ferredoxin oxidoreductase subunit gamma
MNTQEAQITIAGFGGQGVVVAGNIIARASVIENKNVVGMVSYGAEMRGGTANSTVIVSDDEISSPFVVSPNCAIILNQPSLDRFEPIVQQGGLILCNTSLTKRRLSRGDVNMIEVGATEIAHELGNLRVANIVALGAFIGHTKLLKMESVQQAVKDLFMSKNPKLVELNVNALKAGFQRSQYTTVMSQG